MMKAVFVLISFALFAFSKLAFADVVRLAAEDSWPPFAKQDGSGISKAIIEKAYAYSGTKVEFVTVPYARALLMAEQGKVHGAFNVTKQASTESIYAFGERPLLKVSASFYYPPNSKLNYKKLSDIPDDTSVATIIGYEYGDEYEKHKNRLSESRVSSQIQIIKMLMIGRIDMAIMFDEVVAYTLDEMGLDRDAIVRGEINHTSDIYIAFNKELKNTDVINKLDLGLKAIEQESAYITP